MAVFKGLIKKCKVCEKEFKVPQSHARVETCSRECGYKYRNSKYVSSKVELECWECDKKFMTYPSYVESRRFCSIECKFKSEQYKQEQSMRISGDRNPAWNGGISRRYVSRNGIEYSRASHGVESERIARRKRVIELQTPQWASVVKMQGIYESAKKLSEISGIQYHVDHIVPLTSKIVSGLHCEANLQVLPATANLKKHNRSWPDMP